LFRKRPYIGWLLVALFFWGAALYFNHAQRAALRPAAMAEAVAKQQRSREDELNALLKDHALVQSLLTNRPASAALLNARKHHFYVFAYQQDSLVFWNDDDLLASPAQEPDTIGHLVLLNNQYGIRKTYFYPQSNGKLFSIVFFSPIKAAYAYENQYLQSNFNPLRYIPAATEVLSQPEADAYPITNRNGQAWCYLKFPDAVAEQFIPENSTLIAMLLASLTLLMWLQLLILDLSRRKSWKLGLVVTVVLVLVLRACLKLLPLPFNMGELTLFSPVIYAFSWLLSSLGDLLLNELALVWIILFLITETPYKNYWERLRSRPFRYLAAALVLACFPTVIYQLYLVLQSLVLDSQISFDLSHFHTIDEYTIAGLLAIGLGLIILQLVIRFLCAQLVPLIPNLWLRTFLVTAICILFVALFQRSEPMIYVLIAWLALYMLLLEAAQTMVVSMLSLQMIFLSLFTSAAAAIIMHELIQSRDLNKDRIAYAQHILARQDPLMEFNFKSIAPRLKQDNAVHQYLLLPAKENKIALARRLNLIYFNQQADRYLPEYYLFDASGKGLYNIDSTSQAILNTRFEEGMPTEEETLVFTDGGDNNNYLARIPLEGNGKQQEGFLYIVLTLKKSINETVYPELLQPATINRIEKNAHYSYALYQKGKRITQTSNYNFPAFIDTGRIIKPTQLRRVKNGFYELRYQESPDSVVIVAGSTGSWLSASCYPCWHWYTGGCSGG